MGATTTLMVPSTKDSSLSCGYSEASREIVARRVLGKIRMNEWNNIHLQRPLYRSKEQRRDQIKDDKGTWFRSMGATATLMVPCTKDSYLAKKLRIILTSVQGPRGTSVKVVEKPGPALMSGIAVNNPFLPSDCRREDCPQIGAGEECLGKCGREGVLYKAVCLKCGGEDEEDGEDVDGDNHGVTAQYIGESSRTLYVRRKQHVSDYNFCSKRRTGVDDKRTSFMWDHNVAAHGGDLNMDPMKDFQFSVISTYKDPLTRQVTEAVKIQRAMDTKTFQAGGEVIQVIPLNRRSEHFAPISRRQEE